MPTRNVVLTDHQEAFIGELVRSALVIVSAKMIAALALSPLDDGPAVRAGKMPALPGWPKR